MEGQGWPGRDDLPQILGHSSVVLVPQKVPDGVWEQSGVRVFPGLSTHRFHRGNRQKVGVLSAHRLDCVVPRFEYGGSAWGWIF
jgi:hypothetical protein